MIADITQGVLSQIESNSTITIRILDVDQEKGIVSVEAVEEFKSPTNKDGTVSAVRTVILEETEVDEAAVREENKIFKITYLLEDNKTYKIYYIKNNEHLIIPANPNDDFKFWESSGNKLENLNEIIVKSDMIINEVK